MQITDEQKRIIAKVQSGKTTSAGELVTIINPVFNSMGIDPRYVTEGSNKESQFQTTVRTGNKNDLKRKGVPDGHAGWTAKRNIYINNELPPPSQIVTVAHETGHVVLKNATRKEVGKREAERKAHATERVFVGEFNKRYGKLGVELDFGESKSKFKKRKVDSMIVSKNINTRYLRNGYKL